MGCFRASKRSRTLHLLARSALLTAALLGCGKARSPAPSDGVPTGGAGDGGIFNGGSTSSSGGVVTGSGGRTASAGRGGVAGGGGKEVGGEPGCVPQTAPGAAIRRLSRFEYENTLHALFGERSFSTSALPVEPYGDRTAVPSPALVQAQHDLARELAFRVTETESAALEFTKCDLATEREEECRDRFIDEFVGRAFRRPLQGSDVEQFTSTFDGASADGGYALGVRAVVQVALQSPEFLYLPEFGTGAPEGGAGWARPTGDEMASRLSYFLWGSPPDAELLEAAAADALRTPDELEMQARRMLRDERAVGAVGHFYLRLLELDGAGFPAVGRSEYPTFTPEVAGHLLGETQAFTADVTLSSGGDLRTLLTAPFTFVNEPLAAFYGISGVSGAEYRRVDVDATRGGGLLTHASFLAATAQGPFTDPSERGLRVASALLCQSVPRHPVDFVPEPLPPNTTTRERYAEHAARAECAGCHALIDPIGFAFEHFDAAGLYRESENGVAVDATGRLATTDVAGEFDGALELAERLASSDDVRRCFVEKWLAFALARPLTPLDACYVSAIDGAFIEAETKLAELLVALVRSDAFRYRPEFTP